MLHVYFFIYIMNRKTISLKNKSDITIIENIKIKTDSDFYNQDFNDFSKITISSPEALKKLHHLLNLPYLSVESLKDFESCDLDFDLKHIVFDRGQMNKLDLHFDSMEDAILYAEKNDILGYMITKEPLKKNNIKKR